MGCARELFMGLFQTMASKDFIQDSEDLIHVWRWRDFKDFTEKFGDIQNPPENAKLNRILGYFNDVGVLVTWGLINADLVYDLKRIQIIEVWEKFMPIIQGWRVKYSYPQIYVDCESLYNEMKRIREMRQEEAGRSRTDPHSPNPLP